jgi:hypothetical protein
MKSIEYIVGCLIVITLSYIFYPKTPPHQIEPESLDTFDDYPIEYWKSQDEGGDVVWVRYRILQDDTRLWVRDMAGRIVHETPFTLDRHDDGRDRIHKYRWKLYFTEWSTDILPGDYEIIVGSYLQNTTNLTTIITI